MSTTDDREGRAGTADDPRDSLARIIWETSRADEGTISATGANIVAKAVIAAGFRRPIIATDDRAVELIDDMWEAQNAIASTVFDHEMFERARDMILDLVAENQRLNTVLTHRTAQLDRLALAACSCSCHTFPGSALHVTACCAYPRLTEEDSCPVNHAEADCPWHGTHAWKVPDYRDIEGRMSKGDPE